MQTSTPTPEYVAIVTSKHSLIIPAAFQGRIEKLSIKPSQEVKEGEVIAVQDTRGMKSQLKRTRAEQSSAMASAGRGAAEAWGAQKELARDQRLYQAGAIARASMDEAQVKIRSGGASAGEGAGRANAAGATAEDLEWKIQHAEIKAPFNGQISMVKAKEGEVVADGAAIARIFDPSDLIVRFAIPASDKTPIKLGEKVELKIGNQDPIWAVVITVADEIEFPINYRIVEADIDDSKLRPGEATMSALGHVKIAQASSKPTKGNSR